MNAARRTLLVFALITLASVASGCSSMWHELQPHRLQQLNRGPGMPTGPEAYS
ncbi:MAG: hypothetical protein M3552_01945 [Planctomycetota bacterium]|nr:hypothetical protein [Planctomycetaceae bacterium]MDQ3329409.1 hypothetical protein [Planctomycetota bacterium]